jgi:hypothetical protein
MTGRRAPAMAGRGAPPAVGRRLRFGGRAIWRRRWGGDLEATVSSGGAAASSGGSAVWSDGATATCSGAAASSALAGGGESVEVRGAERGGK